MLTYAACIALVQHIELHSDDCQALFITRTPHHRQLQSIYTKIMGIVHELSIEGDDELRITGINSRWQNIRGDLGTISSSRPHILMNDALWINRLINEPRMKPIVSDVSLVIFDFIEHGPVSNIVETMRRYTKDKVRFVYLCTEMTTDTTLIFFKGCHNRDPILVETLQPSPLTSKHDSTIESTNIPVLGATLSIRLALDCSLLKQYSIPIELRCIVFSYVADDINDDNIHMIVDDWCNEEDELSLIELVLQYGHISYWDTSNVTNMKSLFKDCYNFNDNIERWDVSNVISMEELFCQCKSFNQNISKWDVSNVININSMFQQAYSFNQYINNWNVNKIKYMNNVFNSALNFNQPLNNWNVSNVITMCGMFKNCSKFNSLLTNWNVYNVTDMSEMFSMTINFNNDSLNNWQVDNVLNMREMFSAAIHFNGNISLWNVSNVKDMTAMFSNTCNFNQSLIDWKIHDDACVNVMFYGSAMSLLNFPFVEIKEKRSKMLSDCEIDFENM